MNNTSSKAAPGPVFIVGMPRSGTKLLRGLLDQSPDIRFMEAETDFYPSFKRWVAERGEPKSDEDFARLHQMLRHAPYFNYRRLPHAFDSAEWRRWCGRFDASGLFDGFARYETGAAREGAVVWGDKSPSYTRRLALILEDFPNARVIHIVRDVRDYCASMRKAWGKDIRRAALHWGRDVACASAACKAHADRCIELKYEDLLQSPEAQMRRLCGFLGIAYSEAMTRLRRPAENLGDAIGQVEVVRGNSGKFRSRLSEREIRDVESLAYDAMRQTGYLPLHADRQTTMSEAEHTLRRLKDGVRLFMHSAARSGVRRALRFHVTHSRLAH